MKTLRIAFWQANPLVGDVAGNLHALLVKAETLRGKVDLLVTPECYGTGYPIQDLALRPGFVAGFRSELEGLSAAIRGTDLPALLVGGPEEATDLPHNAMFLLDTDGSVRVTRKHHLANAEVYDEVRTFAPGPLPSPIPFRGWKLGVPICEDVWHGDVTRVLHEKGADLIICPNGSHFKANKNEQRLLVAKRNVRDTGLPFVYLNLVGGQDEIVFDGGSFAMDSQGRIECQSGFAEDTFVMVFQGRLDGSTDMSPSGEKEFARPDRYETYPSGRMERIYSALVLGLRDYVNKCGFPGVVLGMSGGIDSALTAAIAVDALGGDRVTLVRMPAKWTSDQSMRDAEAAATMLGARMLTVPVGDVVSAFEAALSPEVSLAGITAENLQARARGTVLMGISNATGLMVLSTGNKSEMTVGYATLYGDMCGGFNAIKDVWKTDVFALSAWRNLHRVPGCLGPREVMPNAIIERPPTAELAPDQQDSNSLGSYEDLDAVLRLIIESRMDAVAAAREASRLLGRKITAEYALRMAGLAKRAEYKRRQAPPGLVTGDGDFSKGWRLPLVNAAAL